MTSSSRTSKPDPAGETRPAASQARSSAKTEFRYAARVPGELTGGRPLATGDVVKLTDAEQADPHNARLITAGDLIPTKEA